MNYYDPLYPAYEATRFEIQRTIAGLQQKLRRRKELDIRIQHDMYQRQAMQRQRQINAQTHELAQIQAEQNLRESLRRIRLLQSRPVGIPSSYSMGLLQRETEAELDYTARLNALRAQRELLNRDMALSGNQTWAHQTAALNRKFVEDDSDQVLVKKYQDGTKINEYNRQLEASNQKRRRQKQHQYSPAKNFGSQKSRQPQTSTGIFENSALNFKTPYDKLQKGSEVSEQSQAPHFKGGSSILKNKKRQSSKKQLYVNEREKNPDQSQNMNERKSRLQADKTFIRQISDLSPNSRSRSNHSNRSNRSNRYTSSKGKLNNKNMSRKSRSKLLDRSRMDNFETDALKKIQNRLIVSSVIYEDSQYRNIKHQMSHLISTYDNQLKARKQIKDKINSHPLILKKHAMVTD